MPVIAISGVYTALRPADLGVEAFFPKPSELSEVVEYVKGLMAAPTPLPLAPSRDVRAAELRDVVESLAQVMGVMAGSIELLAESGSDREELHAIRARALESAQRGSVLMRRLSHLVGILE